MIEILIVVSGAVGIMIGDLISRMRSQLKIAAITTEKTVLEKQIQITEEKLSFLSEAQQHLSDAFKALSSEALKSNNESFLSLAKTTLEKYQAVARGDLDQRKQAITELVKPLKDSLERVDTKIGEVEKSRVEAYSSLTEQIKYLSETHLRLQGETSKLVSALKAPTVRGRWGEVQLKKVVEMSGMVEYCDFTEQETVTTDEGKRLRPDLIVHLPNDKKIVVDSKAPLMGYLEALEAKDEVEREECLARHANQVKTHIDQLSKKDYCSQFDFSPEFVVCFLPGETFFSAALSKMPDLVERGVEKGVILATPTTLIALLKAVYYGWRQELLAENARQISELGKELYERIGGMAGHFINLGKNIDNTVEHYNKTVGSLERMVLVSARKFPELGVSVKKKIGDVKGVEKSSRDLQAPELIEASSSEGEE